MNILTALTLNVATLAAGMNGMNLVNGVPSYSSLTFYIANP